MIGGMALAGLSAAQASAQTAPPAAGSGVEVQELVVTGSRIPQPNMTSISPIQTVTSQEVAISGRTATIDILNTMPQVAINSTQDLGPTSNPLASPGGVATANLRGLGPTRTLVLVDGRRLGMGDPNTGNPNPAPDINQIPSQLIDRVEVLTGGASAVYGSDAIAGVVNFVMKRNFEGLQFDAQYGVNQHGQHNNLMQDLLRRDGTRIPDGAWDGRVVDYSLIFGANAPDGRGNITAYVTYHQQDPVTFSARDWAACQLNVDPTPRCAGSSNSNYFTRADVTGFPEFAVLGNEFVPWGTATTNPPAFYNANELEYLLQGNTRWTGGFFANYEINEHFKPYVDFSFMHDRTSVTIAPSAAFAGDGVTSNGGFLVNCSNPFLSAGQQTAIGCAGPTDMVDLIIGRRNVEGGGRDQLYDHQNYRVVYGLKGKLFGPFNYDLYGSYYYTSLYQSSTNYLSKSRIQNALLVTTDPATGQPVCISGGSCVPWNIFQDGGVSPDAVNYLDTYGTSRGTITEQIVEGTVTGNLTEYGIKSPWATDGLGVAVGFQVRRDHLEFAPDQAELSNDLAGFGGAAVAIDKSLRSAEIYGEVRAPIIQDMPWIRELSLNAGYRYSDYSTDVTADTYKVGLEYAPTQDIRFRASFNRAIRAPSILELYTPQSVTNTSQVSEDPCAAGATHPATLEQCERTGVTPQQYGNIIQCPAEQCAVLAGGSTDLAPEKANTYTVGFLLTPRFIPGFSASVDYFNIDLKGQITNIPLGVTLNQCMTTGDPAYCSQIVRNPSNGILFGSNIENGGYIVGTNANVGQLQVSGIDFQLGYRLGFDTFGRDNWGDLTFAFNGSYLDHNKTTPYKDGPTYDCSGLFGPQCQTLNPRWRHNLRVTWNSPWDVQVSAQWRYIGSTTLETDTDEAIIGYTDPATHVNDILNHEIGAVNYLDLAANWNVNEKLAIRGGINNIFDRDPPVIAASIAGSGSPNAYPTYDYLGRHMFIAFTARF
jgi:outer membrane receptor protein involved in Fe transport